MSRLPSVAIVLLLSACGGGSRPPTASPPSSGDRASFASASNRLGLTLFGRLAPDGANFAISPASIGAALGMTYGGARGTSAAAMAEALGVTTSPEDTARAAGALVSAWNDPSRTAYELAVANRLFGERTYEFRPEFLALSREAFGAELSEVDFVGNAEPSRAEINAWVRERTNSRIAEILPGGSVSSATRLVLVNAVYFHGRWANPFQVERTSDATFHTGAGGDAMVPMMRRNGGAFGRVTTSVGEVLLLELPYAGEEVAMLFALPTDTNAADALARAVSADDVAAWASALRPTHDLEVELPRFRIEGAAYSIRAPLEALGMAELFTPGADLSGISLPGAQPLMLSDVFHRVFVELNEAGTEAAAATGVFAVASSLPLAPPPRFVADHPFLFFLRDLRTDAILFAGRVSDPR